MLYVTFLPGAHEHSREELWIEPFLLGSVRMGQPQVGQSCQESASCTPCCHLGYVAGGCAGSLHAGRLSRVNPKHSRQRTPEAPLARKLNAICK